MDRVIAMFYHLVFSVCVCVFVFILVWIYSQTGFPIVMEGSFQLRPKDICTWLLILFSYFIILQFSKQYCAPLKYAREQPA